MLTLLARTISQVGTSATRSSLQTTTVIFDPKSPYGLIGIHVLRTYISGRIDTQWMDDSLGGIMGDNQPHVDRQKPIDIIQLYNNDGKIEIMELTLTRNGKCDATSSRARIWTFPGVQVVYSRNVTIFLL
jgi:hypothetical protein